MCWFELLGLSRKRLLKISAFCVMQLFIAACLQNAYAYQVIKENNFIETENLSPQISLELGIVQSIFLKESQLPELPGSALDQKKLSLRDSGSVLELLKGNGVFLNDYWARKTMGVAIALSSLRSESDDFNKWDWGMGDLGESMRQHIVWLQANKQSRHLILPVQKTSARFGDPSPYSPLSGFANEDALIAIPEVVDVINSGRLEKWLKANRPRVEALHKSKRVKASAVELLKTEALRTLGFEYFKNNELANNTARAKQFEEFLGQEKNWIDDYALYMTICDDFWGQIQDEFQGIFNNIWGDLDSSFVDFIKFAYASRGNRKKEELEEAARHILHQYKNNVLKQEDNQLRRDIYSHILFKMETKVFPVIIEDIFNMKEPSQEGALSIYEKYKTENLEERWAYIGRECAADWRVWQDKGLMMRDESSLAKHRAKFGDDILFYKYGQFIFLEQWQKMTAFAHEHNITIEGDMPVYGATISCDTWVYKDKVFRLDPNNRYKQLADSGAEPDAFQPVNGQNWGTVPYYLTPEFFKFFFNRVKRNVMLYDGLRIDHFRWFENFWVIPEGKMGKFGQYEDGPREKLLQPLLHEAVTAFKRIFAEDLGSSLENVWKLMEDNNILGMRVAVFGYGKDDDPTHRNYDKTITLSGTHDTTTWVGEWDKLDVRERRMYLDRFFLGQIPVIAQSLNQDGKKELLRFLNYFIDQLKEEALQQDVEKVLEVLAALTDIEGTNLQKLRNAADFLVGRDVLPRPVQSSIFGILAFSEADTVYFPQQDVFLLGEEDRINIPGRPSDWGYKCPYTGEQLNSSDIDEVKKSGELLRMLAETSGRDTSAPRYKKGDGVHILGVLPKIDAKKVRKQGEDFIVWTAVQGDKPKSVSLLTNMPVEQGAAPKETEIEMEPVKQLDSGSYLYGVRITATEAGNWGLAIKADDVLVGDVKHNNSLIVTAQDEIRNLSEGETDVVRTAAGIGLEKIRKISETLMPEKAADMEKALSSYQVGPNSLSKVRSTGGTLVLDVLYNNVNMLRHNLLSEGNSLRDKVMPSLSKDVMQYLHRKYFWGETSREKMQAFLFDLTNIAALPGDPQLIIGQFLGLLESARNSGNIKQEDYKQVRKAAEEIIRFSQDELFNNGDFFLLNDFRDEHSYNDILAFARYTGRARGSIVVSNFSDYEKSGTVWLNKHNFERQFGISHVPGTYYALIDKNTGEVFLREGTDLLKNGLYFDLPGHSSHVFMVQSMQDNERGVLGTLAYNYKGKALGLEHLVLLSENFGLNPDFPAQGNIAKSFYLRNLLNNVTADKIGQAFEQDPDIDMVRFSTDRNEISAQIETLRLKYNDNDKVRALCRALDFLNERAALNEVKLVCSLDQEQTKAYNRSFYRAGGYLYVNISDTSEISTLGGKGDKIKRINYYVRAISSQIERAARGQYGGLSDYDMSNITEAFLALFSDGLDKDIEEMQISTRVMLDRIQVSCEEQTAKQVDQFMSHFNDSFREYIWNHFSEMNLEKYLRIMDSNRNEIKNFAYFLPFYLVSTGKQDDLEKILTANMNEEKTSYYNMYFLKYFISGALALRNKNVDNMLVGLLESNQEYKLNSYIINTMYKMGRQDINVRGVSIRILGELLSVSKETDSLENLIESAQQLQIIETAI